MRKLYGSTSWRRVLALALVFVMMFSIMGTSGYSVFAEGQDEAGEAAYVSEPEAEPAEVEEDVQIPASGEDEVSEPAEEAVEAEPAADEEEAVVESVDETEEEELPAAALEETEEGEEAKEAAEPAEEMDEEGEEPAEEAEETEEAEESAEAEEPVEDTLIAEAAQIIVEDDGAEAPAEEAEEVVEEEAEEALADGEELPEEEILEEEIAMPAIEAEKDFDDARVYVYAPEGAFPEGTTVEIIKVILGRTQVAAVADVVEDQISDYVAYDITFYDADGVEAQPAKPVTVNIEPKKLAEPENLQVVHMEDEKTAVAVEADVTEEGLAFDAESFSVYVVVETLVPRLTVKFMNGETEIASMIIKKADTAEEVAEIIYDPGVGTVPKGQTFKGWTTDGATGLLTIADVRTDAMDKVKELSEDGEVTYTPVYYKQYTVTYVNSYDIAVGTEAVDLPSTETNADYTVNMAFSTDDTHNFEGWTVASGLDNIVAPTDIDEETLIENETEIVIKGDITFKVVAPEGRWLVFDENGKGASYVAPQFVKADTNTVEPVIEMSRFGYTFDGWYDTKEHADAHGANTSVVEGKFEFGSPLTVAATIYASWIPNTSASYAVVFWTQNLDRDGYEVADSYIGSGPVGQIIPFTPVENGDEDYVSGFGMKANTAYPDNPQHPEEIDKGHFIGFCLTEASKNQQISITPEGDAVLNLYYDRILYNFKFYLYKDGTGADQYSYANNSGAGRNYAVNDEDDDLVTWHNNQSAHPDVTGYTMQSETLEDGRTYHYFVLQAYYGEDISKKWPTYSVISGANNRDPVSYVMMVGTKLKPRPTSGGDGTVKGVISVMNENILGDTSDANGNYVVVRFPGGTVYNWRYHIWLETAEGEDYGEARKYTYNGRTYYEADVMTVRSSNTTDANQNEPKYIGFDYVTRLGQNDQGEWGGGHWTTNNPTLYHLNYIYNRQQYKISYFDGNYVNDKNDSLDDRSAHLLHESALIGQGVPIADEYQMYDPSADDQIETSFDGYVFDGWYLDKGCTVPYTWTKMPIGGIMVYAKWRLVQYRVFLHPNANVDLPIDWGKTADGKTPSMCFRVDYGEQISAPTGVQTGYEFYGWYWADGSVFNESTKIKSGTAYNKETDYTDPMDEYGVIGDNPSNSDLTGYNGKDRFWITERVDLYAKWGEIIVGADGITVKYNANGGSNAPTDDALHKDNTPVGAGPAATAPEGKVFDHWVVQKWNSSDSIFEDTDETVLPGVEFNVLKGNAKITIADTETAVDPADVTEDGDYDYTVMLKAVYKDVGEKTPTHIAWYSNYGDENDNKGEQYRYDTLDEAGNPTLGINVGVDILEAPSRPGYVFKGWTKTQGGTTANFLIWTENGYTDVNGNAAKQVAADEKQNQGQYDDLFAVWEEDEVTINYAVADDSPNMGSVSLASETVKAENGTAAGSTATPSGDYVFDYWTCDDGTAHVGETAKFTPSKNSDGVYEAHTYYAHFKEETVEPVTYTIEYHTNYNNTADEKQMIGYDRSTTLPMIILSPDVVKGEMDGEEIAFTTGLEWTNPVDQKTWKFTGWNTEPDGSGTPYAKDDEYNVATDDQGTGTQTGDDQTGESTDPVVTNEAGSSAITINARRILAMVATSSEGDAADLTLYAQWEEVVEPVEPNPHLTVTKTTTSTPAKDGKYALGETISYKITVTNDGNQTISNVVVTDELTGDVWPGENEVLTLEPGDSKVYTTSYTVQEKDILAGKVLNEATATGYGPEDDPEGDPEVPVTPGTKEDETEDPNPHLTVSKTTTSTPPEGRSYYKEGETITYTITVTNDGNLTVGGITIEDSLPVTIGENDSFEIKSLEPGASETITVSYTVTADDVTKGSVKNVATAIAPNPADDPDDPDDDPNVPVKDGETEDSTKPSGGGGTTPKDPTPKEEPDEPIDEPDTPLAPIEEEPDEPVEEPDEPFAGYEEEPDEEVGEEPMPFSPYTGDNRHTAVWGLVSILSLAGIAVVVGKRREE